MSYMHKNQRVQVSLCLSCSDVRFIENDYEHNERDDITSFVIHLFKIYQVHVTI